MVLVLALIVAVLALGCWVAALDREVRAHIHCDDREQRPQRPPDLDVDIYGP